MASGGDNGNLVQDFEEAFQKCISALTEEDDLNERDAESEGKNIEQKITHFTDLARNLETFFLSKRFLIYNHKPEYILKEDTLELRSELVRKDELIRKHYDKLGQWQNMLADVQGVQAGPGQGQGPAPPGAGMPRGPGGPPGPGGPGSPLPGPGGPTPHGGFVPGPQYSRMPGGGMGAHGGFGGAGGPQQSLQGPLAYLERTTSNIGGSMGAMGPGGGMGMMNR